MLNIPYSGSDPLALGLSLDKIITKKIAFHAGIPTPRYRVIKELQDIKSVEKLSCPLITKPAWEGSSKGIYNSSKVFDIQGVEKNVKQLFEKYPDQPVLVEEYIEGREITAGIIGNDSPQILGLMEIINKKNPDEGIFYSLETKRDWQNLVDYISPPDISQMTDKRIKYYAALAFKEFGLRDVARVDFRLSENGRVFMLEINPLPGLSPLYADLVILAKKHRLEYEDLVMSILNKALSRYKKIERDVSHEAV